MPDKLCRTCGGDLIKWSACSECRKITQKICKTCNVKTIEEIHSHRIHLVPYQIVNSTSTIATVQSYNSPTNSKAPKKNRYSKNYRNNILVVSGIIVGIMISGIIAGIMVLGMTSTSHPESFSSPRTSQIQVSPPSDHPSVVQSETQHIDATYSSTDVKYTYSNCLGVSDGMYLTVTCPTEYGNVYKAVVDIPSELMSQFENSVFNLRDLSIIEHIDSISIQYAKKMYEAKFVNS